jgi:hypothetical protein
MKTAEGRRLLSDAAFVAILSVCVSCVLSWRHSTSLFYDNVGKEARHVEPTISDNAAVPTEATPTGSTVESETLFANGENDEILDAVIKTATGSTGLTPRDNRRRSRNATRKSRNDFCFRCSIHHNSRCD